MELAVSGGVMMNAPPYIINITYTKQVDETNHFKILGGDVKMSGVQSVAPQQPQGSMSRTIEPGPSDPPKTGEKNPTIQTHGVLQ